MSSTSRLRRPALLISSFLLALGLGACLGCGGEPAAPESMPASALRQRFPERAALVLEQGETFVATEEGFALVRPDAPRAYQGVEVALPRDGREAIRFRGFGGAEVRVRELGAEGEGAVAERAVAYPRAGGTSFWMAAAGGVEEWLHLEASAVHAGEAVAAWEVEGAGVRQRGEGVEIVDAGGVVRLSVTAPVAYAAGGREIVARLVGSGARIALMVDAVGEAMLVDPLWTTATPMSLPRQNHTATLLAGGKVLVAGGHDSSSRTATAELYDPATNAWSSIAAMSQTRAYAISALLGSGKVVVAGGLDNQGTSVANVELYDPAMNSWSPTGSLTLARAYHAAVLLGSGKVLTVGGQANGSYLPSAEVYDPATTVWSAAGALTQARVSPTITTLANGNAVVGTPALHPAWLGLGLLLLRRRRTLRASSRRCGATG